VRSIRFSCFFMFLAATCLSTFSTKKRSFEKKMRKYQQEMEAFFREGEKNRILVFVSDNKTSLGEIVHVKSSSFRKCLECHYKNSENTKFSDDAKIWVRKIGKKFIVLKLSTIRTYQNLVYRKYKVIFIFESEKDVGGFSMGRCGRYIATKYKLTEILSDRMGEINATEIWDVFAKERVFYKKVWFDRVLFYKHKIVLRKSCACIYKHVGVNLCNCEASDEDQVLCIGSKTFQKNLFESRANKFCDLIIHCE